MPDKPLADSVQLPTGQSFTAQSLTGESFAAQPEIQPSIMEALVQVSLAINSELAVSEILHNVVEWTRQLLNCTASSILLWDAEKETFERGASTDIGPQVKTRVRQQGGASRWIITHNQPLIISDIQSDPFVSNAMVAERGILSYAGTPLTHKNEPIGILYVMSKEQRAFDQGEMQILDSLASMASLALINAELLESQRSLNEQLRAFMRLAAHDLINPLNNIQGFLDLLLLDLGALSPEHQQWLEVIQRSISHMHELIQEVVAHQQRDEAVQKPDEPVELNAVCRDVLHEYSLTAAKMGLTLTPPAADQPMVVMGDPTLLREVMHNLVANAVKYTPDGGTISVDLEEEGREILIGVHDTGIGIAPKDQIHLFKPFVRLDGAVEQAEGFGLGLHLVKGIIDQHQGKISLDSTVGKGTTVWVRLPMAPKRQQKA